MKITKTNAMRALDSAKLTYQVHEYPHGKEAVDGIHVAQAMGEDPCCVFKTLITQANTREYLVFMIPVGEELDLSLLHRRGVHVLILAQGPQAVGRLVLVEHARTFIDSSALTQSHIYFSGGKIGLQIEMDPKQLIDLLSITPCPLTK